MTLTFNNAQAENWTENDPIKNGMTAVSFDFMEGYLSKKSIHINESFVYAIALALW